MKCFFWMVLVLVCVVATAEARTPEWLIALPEGCGVLNTKAGKDGNCHYTVGGKVFKFPQMKDAEVTEQRKFFGWDITVRRTVRPFWSVEVSPCAPPQVDLGSIVMQHQQQQMGNTELGPVDLTGWESKPIDWIVVYETYAKTNEAMEKDWRAEVETSFVRIAGDAEHPTGMFVNLVQQVADTAEFRQFIIDQQTGTIWQRP